MRDFYLDLITTGCFNNNNRSFFSLFAPNCDCDYSLFQSLVYFMLERTAFHISSHISPAACSEELCCLLCWASSPLWTSCLSAARRLKSNGACELKKKGGGPLAMLNEKEVRFGTRHYTHGTQSEEENPCIYTGGSPARDGGGWSAVPAMK